RGRRGLRLLALAQARHCALDSLPVPVVRFHLVPGSGGDWDVHGAAFGVVPSKKQTIYGYKLHLLVTFGGVILDFHLAGANEPDLAVGLDLLSAYSDLTALGDKAYISAPEAEALWQQRRIRLLTLPRKNQRRQLPPAVAPARNSGRRVHETVNRQLAEPVPVAGNHPPT